VEIRGQEKGLEDPPSDFGLLTTGSCRRRDLIDKPARLRYSVQADFIGYFCRKENMTVRERERELARRRKRKKESLKLRSKTAKAEAAAKKGK